jgi:hypothetical protein
VGGKDKVMTSKVNYKTWFKNDLVDAADLNEQVRDNGNALWSGENQGDVDFYAGASNKDLVKKRVVVTRNSSTVSKAIGDNGTVLKLGDPSPYSHAPSWEPFCGARATSPSFVVPANGSYGFTLDTTVSYGYPAIFYVSGGIMFFNTYDVNLGMYVKASATCKISSNGYAGKAYLRLSGYYYDAGYQNLSDIYKPVYMDGVNDFYITADELFYVPPLPSYTFGYVGTDVHDETGHDLTIDSAHVSVARLT